MKDMLAQYYSKLREIRRLGNVLALLSWDEQNNLPSKGRLARAEQSAFLSKLIHEYKTDKEFGTIITKLFEKKDSLSSEERRSVELAKKSYEKVVKLPTEFVSSFSELTSKSYHAWVDAKKKSSFSSFQPFLQQIVDMTKKYAEYIDPDLPEYDVLLDDYEEDLTSDKLESIFSTLEHELPPLLKKIKKKTSNRVLEELPLQKSDIQPFLEEVCKKIGYDFEKGVFGDVPHPFMIKLSEGDIRLNVSYPKGNVGYSITSAIHELGHSLYEQNVDEKYYKLGLGSGVSLGIHESQSRLLENIIGRSFAFWKYVTPMMQKYFPNYFSNVSVEEIVNDLTVVTSSYIRTEADEVTYNLHILLRYRIEREMLQGSLKIIDVPERWNELMKQYLDIVPPSDDKGVLQDMHWSGGAIAYFPTYTLGNLYAAQMWNSFEEHQPNWENQISNGDFSTYFSWFKHMVWQYGSMVKPDHLIKQISGESLKPDYFISYIKKRYIENQKA